MLRAVIRWLSSRIDCTIGWEAAAALRCRSASRSVASASSTCRAAIASCSDVALRVSTAIRRSR